METKIGVSFLLGGIFGGMIMLWMVATLDPTSHFAYFDKSCIISDLGPQWQVDCPPSQ